MPAQSSIYHLARQLLRVADAELLDMPLEALARQLEDETAKESLGDLVAANLADTLRDALLEDRLDRFVAESCTQSEEHALCRTLMQMLGGGAGGVHDDDTARLVQVPPPPDDPRALTHWAREHGILHVLQSPLRSHWPESTSDDSLTVQRAWLLEGGDNRTPLSAQRDASYAEATLIRLAREHAAIEARSALWSRSPIPQLQPLVQRLRSLVEDATPAELAALRFVPARPVTVDEESALVCGQVRNQDGATCSVQLFLSGYEQRRLSGQCSLCGASPCTHLRVLGGRVLDAALDEQDRLHASLRTLVAQPSWRRFVNALHGPQTQSPARSAKTTGQLSFVLKPQGARLLLSVYLHKALRGGGHSTGKQVAAARAVRLTAATDRDRTVLDAILLGSRPLSTLQVAADPLLLRALSDHPRVRMAEDDALVRITESALTVDFVEQPDGIAPVVQLAGQPLQGPPPPEELTFVYRLERGSEVLFFAPLPLPVRRLMHALTHFRGVLPEASHAALGPFVAELRSVAQVTVPPSLLGRELPPQRRLLLRMAADIGEALSVALTTRPLPLGALWPPGQGPALVHGLVDGQQTHARRDLSWERDAARRVLATLSLHAQSGLDPFVFRVDDRTATLEMLKAAATLTDVLDLEWSERARRLTLAQPITRAALQVQVQRKGQWLELQGGALSHESIVAVGRLLEAARRGERFVPIAFDTYAEIEEALRERLLTSGLSAELLKGVARLPACAAPVLPFLVPDATATDSDTAAFLDEAKRAAHTDPAAIPNEELAPFLRSYQRMAVRWLLQLAQWSTGACVADEMGLGKTVQAIAFLQRRAGLGPALVLSPTSVTNNWLAEVPRFAPELRVRNYRGPERGHALRALGAHDVVVASYDLLTRDAAAFAEQPFATVVLDESQWLKNASTQRARAVMAVPAQFRLALSGTPLENRLGDLWSLFALIAPGYLGTWRRFRAVFAVPIERYENDERRTELRSLVSPFLLRRTKAQVEGELPPKTEIVHRVELSTAEQELYRTAVVQARTALGKRRKHDAPRTAHVLAELTRLRQLACHPRLVLKESTASSSKQAALLQLLNDIVPRGHRVLIFSQFVSHLSLVREALDAQQLAYFYLDGSTPSAERKVLVDNFQAGMRPLFLISLKAGGTGLNLTAADYVVHLDPWWNPATEDQASDRAHRIGQRHPVTVVKLVAADTIEDRVLSLHASKRELASALLEGLDTPTRLDLAAMETLLAFDLQMSSEHPEPPPSPDAL